MRRRSFLLGFVSFHACCLALAACGGEITQAPSKAPAGAPAAPASQLRKAKVGVATAVRKEIEVAVKAAGAVEAAGRIKIAAGVAGIVGAIDFREGSVVAPDTVLCTVDADRYDLLAGRAEAEHERAAARADLAASVYEARKKLREEGLDRDKAWVSEEQLATWETDMRAAEAEADRARADLELARRDARLARVRPPLAGTIEERLVQPGEYVRPDSAVATMLDTSSLQVRFAVSAGEAALLAKGQEAAFAPGSAAEAAFRGRIFHIAREAVVTDGAAGLRDGVAIDAAGAEAAPLPSPAGTR